jgi:hypothetical protein
MRHFVIVTLVGVITLTIVFALYRPDLLEGVWLWIVGLIGPIIGIGRKVVDRLLPYIKSLSHRNNQQS